GSDDGVDTQSKVPNEPTKEQSGTDEGAGSKPEVPDVPKYKSDSEEESWTFSEGDDDEDDNNDESDAQDDDANEYDDDDQRVYTPPDYQSSEESEKQEDDDMDQGAEEEHDDEEMLYAGQQQRSSASSDLVSKFTNTSQDEVSALESDVSSLKNSNPFAEAVSSIPGIVDAYLGSKLKETVDMDVQLKSDKLREEAQAENQEFLNSLDSNMQKIIKEQVKAKTSKIMSKVEKYVTETLEAEVLVRSTNQPQTSYGVATSLSELELKKILMDKIEENKSIDRLEVQKNLYNALVEAYNSDKDLISSYGDVVIIPTTHDDKDKDEGPSARSNRGSKRWRSNKEAESSREPSHKESRTTSSSRGATRSQPTDLEDLSHQEFTTGGNEVTPVRETHVEHQWHPSNSPDSDHGMANLTKNVSD
ncbi:hypothetical protein Tco_0908118, partial [Tanacetum coccineum]